MGEVIMLLVGFMTLVAMGLVATWIYTVVQNFVDGRDITEVVTDTVDTAKATVAVIKREKEARKLKEELETTKLWNEIMRASEEAQAKKVAKRKAESSETLEK